MFLHGFYSRSKNYFLEGEAIYKKSQEDKKSQDEHTYAKNAAGAMVKSLCNYGLFLVISSCIAMKFAGKSFEDPYALIRYTSKRAAAALISAAYRAPHFHAIPESALSCKAPQSLDCDAFP